MRSRGAWSGRQAAFVVLFQPDAARKTAIIAHEMLSLADIGMQQERLGTRVLAAEDAGARVRSRSRTPPRNNDLSEDSDANMHGETSRSSLARVTEDSLSLLNRADGAGGILRSYTWWMSPKSSRDKTLRKTNGLRPPWHRDARARVAQQGRSPTLPSRACGGCARKHAAHMQVVGTTRLARPSPRRSGRPFLAAPAPMGGLRP